MIQSGGGALSSALRTFTGSRACVFSSRSSLAGGIGSMSGINTSPGIREGAGEG